MISKCLKFWVSYIHIAFYRQRIFNEEILVFSMECLIDSRIQIQMCYFGLNVKFWSTLFTATWCFHRCGHGERVMEAWIRFAIHFTFASTKRQTDIKSFCVLTEVSNRVIDVLILFSFFSHYRINIFNWNSKCFFFLLTGGDNTVNLI